MPHQPALTWSKADGAPRACPPGNVAGKPVVPETIATYADLPSPAVAAFAKAGASVGHPPVSEIRRSVID